MPSVKKNHPDARNSIKSALKELGRAETELKKTKKYEAQMKERHNKAKAKTRQANTAAAKQTEHAARKRLQAASKQRQKAAARHKEASMLLHEQEQLAKELERKERAKKKAVAAFIKKWEREYDRDVARKKQNIELRKKMVRDN